MVQLSFFKIKPLIPRQLIYCILLVTLVACADKMDQGILKNRKGVEQSNKEKMIAEVSSSLVTTPWREEFNDTLLDGSTWNRQVEKAGRFNKELQRYTDHVENAFIENDQLIISLNKRNDGLGSDSFTSARLNTAQKRTFLYGTIEARIKLPRGAGLWPAFWTLGENIDENGGDTRWPMCGEIDILELYGSRDNGVVEANAHYANRKENHSSMGSKSYKLDKAEFADDFHIFTLEWTETELIWKVDGTSYATFNITGAEKTEFHQPHFLLLNIAVGGTWSGAPDGTTVFPQRMIVDYIDYKPLSH
ncbi:MAG: glycoside hydrolase family 16 protein [Nonlabens sp.]